MRCRTRIVTNSAYRNGPRPKSGDGATDNERIDLACTLVGIDGLRVGDEAGDVMIQQDAVSAEKFARPTDRFSRPHGAEGFRQRGVLLAHQARVLQLG